MIGANQQSDHQLQGDEEEMQTQFGTEHQWLVAINNQALPYLNIGNDNAASIDVTVSACPAREGNDPVTSKNGGPKNVKAAPYSAMKPGVDLRALAREKWPGFTGMAMVTAKSNAAFASGIDTLKG